MDVSIVIVSYNARDYLRECLRSIEGTTPTSLQYEVIVVDNASTDGAPDMVASEFPWVRLIRNASNVGFSRANNQGAAASTGRYVLLLNPDTVVLDGAITAMVEFADQHPDAAVVGCTHLDSDGNLAHSIGYGYISPRPARVTRVQRLDRGWVSGACMLLRRAACEQVGWLDESFFFGAEDVEICWRMRKAGWHIYATPAARIIHHGAKSTESNPGVRQLAQAHRREMVRRHAHPLVYRLWSIVHAIEQLPRSRSAPTLPQ